MPDIKIKSLEGREFSAYVAAPRGGNGAGVLVIQEIFGVNAAMRIICDQLAAKGYFAVCPDLYWRQEPDLHLSDQNPADWDHALALFKAFDIEAGVRDLFAALAHTRCLPGSSGKVGALGHCLGGKLAYLVAARSDVDCAVSYYGVGLENLLEESLDVRSPLLMHFGEQDKFISPSVQQKILTATRRNPAITVKIYPHADHAFARPEGQKYNSEAAELASRRTEAFFADHLQQ